MKKLIITAALIILPLSPLLAEEDWGVESPFAMGAGSRGIAMGSAAAAVWGDSYALFWNPAGLYFIERSEADIFHTSLFDESTTYSSLQYSHPFLDIGVISLGAVQLRVGGIEQRDSENSVIDGELKNLQTRYYLCYAKDLYKGFAGGLNLKLDRYDMGTYVGSGFGVDLGLGLNTPVESPIIDGMAVGFSLVNLVEPTISLVEREVGDPRSIRVGFSLWRMISRKMDDRLLLSIDFDKNRYSEVHFHTGGEYRIYDFFTVRGGWDAGLPTFGCGFQLNHVNFDYAYRSTDLGGNHLFSLIFRFGSSRTEKLAVKQQKRDEELKIQVEEQMNRFEDQFVSSALESGEESLEAGRYEEAIDHFQSVLLWSPGNEEAGRGMKLARASFFAHQGDSLMQGEHYAEALFSYRQAYESLQAPEILERIQFCEKQLEKVGDRRKVVDDILARSLELYTIRNWDGAIKGFEKVLELDPGNELASMYLGKAIGKIEESFNRMIARTERLISEGRYSSALAVLQEAKKKYPDDQQLEAMLNEVTGLQKRAVERKKEEIQTETAQVSISPQGLKALRIPYVNGVRYFRAGNFSRAIAEWETVWRSYPEYEKVDEYLVKAYQYMGMEYYAQNQYEEALEVWGRILDVDPDNEKAIRYINRTREELSRLEGYTGR